MSDSDFLASAVCTYGAYGVGPSGRKYVQFEWPDGFRFASHLDQCNGEDKARNDAACIRGEFLRRKGLTDAS